MVYSGTGGFIGVKGGCEYIVVVFGSELRNSSGLSMAELFEEYCVSKTV